MAAAASGGLRADQGVRTVCAGADAGRRAGGLACTTRWAGATVSGAAWDADAGAGGWAADDAGVPGGEDKSDREGDQWRLSERTRHGSADGSDYPARLLRYRRRASVSEGGDGGDRVRARRALQ